VGCDQCCAGRTVRPSGPVSVAKAHEPGAKVLEVGADARRSGVKTPEPGAKVLEPGAGS
jgi:hypothetical protein